MQQIIRDATHWGTWYQKSKELLQKELQALMINVPPINEKILKGIVSP